MATGNVGKNIPYMGPFGDIWENPEIIIGSLARSQMKGPGSWEVMQMCLKQLQTKAHLSNKNLLRNQG